MRKLEVIHLSHYFNFLICRNELLSFASGIMEMLRYFKTILASFIMLTENFEAYASLINIKITPINVT